MKIKRFFAKDMRAALAQVKDILGSDAVIMSNKKISGGTEIIAAVDYDSPKAAADSAETQMDGVPMSEDRVSLGSRMGSSMGSIMGSKLALTPGANLGSTAARPSAQNKVSASQNDENNFNSDSLQALLEKQRQHLKQQQSRGDLGNGQSGEEDLPAWARALSASKTAKSQSQATGQPKKNQSKLSGQSPTSSQAQNQSQNQGQERVMNRQMDSMQQEISQLRQLLTHQVSSLMTQKNERLDPVGSMLKKQLLAADFSQELATKLANLSHEYSPAQLAHKLPETLARMLKKGNDIVHGGGVVALVGPTGVGKTTTIAKLAARYASRHGVDQVGLITTDHYRIGAYEQLATYGRIMGCPVKRVEDIDDLEQVLYQFRSRKLVLIDTAGMGQRDTRLYQQLDSLCMNKQLPISAYLVMSAASQRQVLQEALEHFQRIPLAGGILTKLDESVSLGGGLSVLVQSGLPLCYVADGQRVPEDLNLADPLTLATQGLARLDEYEIQATQDSMQSDEMNYAVE